MFAGPMADNGVSAPRDYPAAPVFGNHREGLVHARWREVTPRAHLNLPPARNLGA